MKTKNIQYGYLQAKFNKGLIMVNGNLLGLLRNGAFLSSLSGKADLNFGNSAKTQAERTGAGKKKLNRKHLYTETYERSTVLRKREAFAFSALGGFHPFARKRTALPSGMTA